MEINQVYEWLRAAKGDLRTLSYLEQDPELTHIVAFHAQQC